MRKRQSHTQLMIVVVVVVGLLAATMPESSFVAAVQDFILSDKSCYISGEAPLISFDTVRPTDEDWIGIYPSGNVSPDADPSLWLWTCGTQECWGKMTRGSISFGKSSEYVDIWPLDAGSYRAVLARNSQTDEFAYDFAATSPIFKVDSSCGTVGPEPNSANPTNMGPSTNIPTIATPTTNVPATANPTTYTPTSTAPSTRAPATVVPSTKEPINASPATSHPSLRTPTPVSTDARLHNTQNKSMSSVIAAPNQELASLIRANPTLGPLLLRMVFHDCVGGCDGCINISSPENARLDSAMYSLDSLVTKYEPMGLTRPDIWVLAATTGVELSMLDTEFCAIPFTSIGRQPCEAAHMTEGPNPEVCSSNIDTDDILIFFRATFGFTPQEAAALMGAHTVGRLRRDVLGFDGPNGRTLDNALFNNGYYKELVGPGTTYQEQVDNAPNWHQAFVDNSDLLGIPNRYQWEGSTNGEKIVMTNSDIALVRQLDSGNKAENGHVGCQFVPRGGSDETTCPMARSDLFVEMVKYRNDNQRFLHDFRDAFTKMTQTGYVVDTSSCDQHGICRLVKA